MPCARFGTRQNFSPGFGTYRGGSLSVFPSSVKVTEDEMAAVRGLAERSPVTRGVILIITH